MRIEGLGNPVSRGWQLGGEPIENRQAEIENGRWQLWGLFAFLLVLYSAGSLGIVCSNDGSHYALVRSLGDRASGSIDRYVHYTGFLDVSHFRGHWYSDRPPGTAVLALPFYLLGKAAAAGGIGHQPRAPKAVKIPSVVLFTPSRVSHQLSSRAAASPLRPFPCGASPPSRSLRRLQG